MSVSPKYKRDPVKKRVYEAAWRAKNPKKLQHYRRTYRAKHPVKVRDRNYKANYGISYAEVFAMWLAQEKHCKCCDEPIRFPARHTHLDHDHLTGKVRGLLCARCNALLGYAGDSVDLLRRAITYLR
jgi:hypothetical protein